MADKFRSESHLLAAINKQLVNLIQCEKKSNVHWMQVKKCMLELRPTEEIHEALGGIEKVLVLRKSLIDDGYEIAVKAEKFFKERSHGPTWKHANKIRYSMARRNVFIYP